MDFAANFTAIDFETATRRADSACQLAAVTVRDGSIVDKAMWMIRPEPLYFSRFNIQIHGITPQQVQKAAVFGDLWPEIAEKLGDDCLVAHNAKFDIGVLTACLRTHRHPIPDLHFTCTRAIARTTWPHLRRYGLKPLADWLGIRFRHHDALEDSIACAKILLAAGIDKGAESLEDLEKRLKLVRGEAGDWGCRTPRRRRRSRSVASAEPPKSKPALPFLAPEGALKEPAGADADDEIDMQRLLIRAEFIRPLSGIPVAFAGPFQAITRDQAETLASRLGGECQPAVDESTRLLVVGRYLQRDKREDDEGQLVRAQQLCAQGAAIEIVDETDFLGLVISPADKASK